jgi:hypothetical protein
MPWKIFAASAIGSSHREDGRPCQDAFAHRTEGQALFAAVCDGAGSCESSDLGARLLADIVVQSLAELAGKGGLSPDIGADAFQALVEDVVAGARDDIMIVAANSAGELGAYASTLVGVAIWPAGGHVFHVGDGYAVVRQDGAGKPDIVSLPENGEYVNETYFVTGDEWRAHLRTQSFGGPVATVVLMSDGAAPFAMGKGRQALHAPFIDPVVRYLDQVSETEGAEALASTLGDPRTDAITNDDKTLLIARRA